MTSNSGKVNIAKFFQLHGLPEVQTEYRFHPVRRWRFDYAWPGHKVALEIEGGIFPMRGRKGGAHGSVTGILRDIAKYNSAVMFGWRVVRVLPRHELSDETIEMLKVLINGEKPQ